MGQTDRSERPPASSRSNPTCQLTNPPSTAPKGARVRVGYDRDAFGWAYSLLQDETIERLLARAIGWCHASSLLGPIPSRRARHGCALRLWMQPPELRAQRIGDPSHLATSFCDGIEPTARGGRFDGEVGPVGDCLGPSPPQPTASMRSATNTTAGREFSAPLSQPPTALRNRESSRLCRPVLKPLGNGLVVDIDVASKRSSGQADDSGNVEWS